MSTVEYTDEDGRLCKWKSDYLVKKAFYEALAYGDNTKLLIAIKHGLPELLESEEARENLTLIINGGIKTRGFKPKKNKLDHDRNSKLWKQVNWYKGKGYPVWSLDHVCACELTGDNVGLSKDQVYRIYRENFGGETPGFINGISASFFRSTAENEDQMKPAIIKLIKKNVGIK